jgi:hypothetical protein
MGRSARGALAAPRNLNVRSCSGGANDAVVGSERHHGVDFEKTGSDEGRQLQDSAGRLFVLGFDQQALSGSIAAVPNLPDDPRLTKIAEQAGFGFQAAMEIGFATPLRAPAR